jgi:serine/threonine protein kinase
MADQPIDIDKKKPKNNNEASPEAPEEEENPEKEKNCEGKQIGGFIIGKTKGKGTFGKVKQGTHVVTGDKVAIKILEKDKIKD